MLINISPMCIFQLRKKNAFYAMVHAWWATYVDTRYSSRFWVVLTPDDAMHRNRLNNPKKSFLIRNKHESNLTQSNCCNLSLSCIYNCYVQAVGPLVERNATRVYISARSRKSSPVLVHTACCKSGILSSRGQSRDKQSFYGEAKFFFDI